MFPSVSDLLDFELLFDCQLPDMMLQHLNVLLLHVIDGIVDEVDCALRVAIDDRH